MPYSKDLIAYESSRAIKYTLSYKYRVLHARKICFR